MKRLRALLVLTALSLIGRADPVVDLAQALDRLQHHSNYTWSTTITPTQVSIATRTIADPNRAPEAAGKWIDDGYVVVPIVGASDVKFGTIRTAPVSRTPPGSQSIKVVSLGDRTVFGPPAHWFSAAEFDTHVLESSSMHPAPRPLPSIPRTSR